MWGVRKHIYGIYCQYEKLLGLSSFQKAGTNCQPEVQSDKTTANLATCLWQGERRVGGADCSGLIEAADCKDNHSLGKKEGVSAPSMREKPTSIGYAD